jgi:hypothetical protein
MGKAIAPGAAGGKTAAFCDYVTLPQLPPSAIFDIQLFKYTEYFVINTLESKNPWRFLCSTISQKTTPPLDFTKH